ncbi:helix-turn-helix domain-containing protein, partial [Streptomyces sp. URMC 123]|uniref:helix-turn-helix domain-containing protein n=1 Tax=Streptomyces sp. URMC 123 TaxID=3423403 RepID=UPI003F1A141B
MVNLRRLKDRSELSLAALAARTSYSRSSWERYLNGKKLPPREAVEELATICGADATRLLVLHEIADEAWRRELALWQPATPPAEAGPGPDGPAGGPREDGTPAAGAPPPEDPEPPARSPRLGRRARFAAAAAALALVGLTAGLLAAAPWEDERRPSDRASGPSAAAVPPASGTHTEPYVHRPGQTFPCRVERQDGLLYAGHSRTRDAILQLTSTSWDVVEAQCLLRHHGFATGA